MKLGGWVGIGLGAAASGLKVKETCRAGTEEACRKVQFTEAGKFGGVLLGGAGAPHLRLRHVLLLGLVL